MQVDLRRDVTAATAATSVILVAQLLMMTLQTTLTAPSTDGRSYTIGQIPNGTRLTQLLTIGANGFDSVRIDGKVTGTAGAGAVDVAVIDISDSETEQRRTVADIRDGTCCVIEFAPLPQSAGRRFRLELGVRDLPRGSTLELPAVLKPGVGGLTINDRETRADLRMRVAAAGGTVLGRLRRSDLARQQAVPALFMAVSLTTGLAVFGLLRVFRSTS